MLRVAAAFHMNYVPHKRIRLREFVRRQHCCLLTPLRRPHDSQSTLSSLQSLARQCNRLARKPTNTSERQFKRKIVQRWGTSKSELKDCGKPSSCPPRNEKYAGALLNNRAQTFSRPALSHFMAKSELTIPHEQTSDQKAELPHKRTMLVTKNLGMFTSTVSSWNKANTKKIILLPGRRQQRMLASFLWESTAKTTFTIERTYQRSQERK